MEPWAAMRTASCPDKEGGLGACGSWFQPLPPRPPGQAT